MEKITNTRKKKQLTNQTAHTHTFTEKEGRENKQKRKKIERKRASKQKL